MMKKTLISFISISTLLLLGSFILLAATLPAHAEDKPLPASPWYAVLYQERSEVLRWINAEGEQVVMPRPTLPNENAQNPDPQIRISPDGRYMVIAAVLASENYGLGIYDIASGTFLKTHEAVPTEIINLGSGQIFNPAGTRVAVGFMSGDFENTAWRVILFELATGDALSYADQGSPFIQPGSPAIPEVMFYGGSGPEEAVHFQLVPLNASGSFEWPSYVWYPDAASRNAATNIQASGYTRAGSDVLYSTGEMVFSYVDPNFGALDTGGIPVDNAIGRQVPGAPVTPIWVDASMFNVAGHWALGGQWVLFNSNDGQNPAFWNVIRADGTPTSNERTPLSPDVVDVAGTGDGFLMVTAQGQLYHSTDFADAEGTEIFASGEQFEIIYVTPAGVTVGLQSVAVPDGFTPREVPISPTSEGQETIIIPTPAPTATSSATCNLAPASRISVGMVATVGATPINLLANIGDTEAIQQLTPGTTLPILAGPLCESGYRYWQVLISVPDGTLQGWVSEGEGETYFIVPPAQ
jgi:hypothetical protein